MSESTRPFDPAPALLVAMAAALSDESKRQRLECEALRRETKQVRADVAAVRLEVTRVRRAIRDLHDVMQVGASRGAPLPDEG